MIGRGKRNEKYLAEFIGTLALVTMGCGTAMLVGCDAASGCGYLLTALAFGLSIVAMAYCIGNISGCHVNPAVSLGVFLSGGMSIVDFIGYVIAQCLGAFAGAGILAAIFHLGDVTDKTGGYGSNGLAGVNDSIFAGLLVEIILTFLFVLTILGLLRRKPIMVPSAVWSSVYPDSGTYPGDWINWYLRKPCQKSRPCNCCRNFRQYNTNWLCMGISRRTFDRRRTGSTHLSGTGRS